MIRSLMSILIIILCLSHCTKPEFDPTTSILKWVITNEK